MLLSFCQAVYFCACQQETAHSKDVARCWLIEGGRCAYLLDRTQTPIGIDIRQKSFPGAFDYRSVGFAVENAFIHAVSEATGNQR